MEKPQAQYVIVGASLVGALKKLKHCKAIPNYHPPLVGGSK